MNQEKVLSTIKSHNLQQIFIDFDIPAKSDSQEFNQSYIGSFEHFHQLHLATTARGEMSLEDNAFFKYSKEHKIQMYYYY